MCKSLHPHTLCTACLSRSKSEQLYPAYPFRGTYSLHVAQVTEQQLRAIFQPFGEIVYVKIPSGKGCGFVQFTQRSNAETAMLQLNGQVRFVRGAVAQACISTLGYCDVRRLWSARLVSGGISLNGSSAARMQSQRASD